MITAVQPYIHLLRLHKPIGTFLLLWPTLSALVLASNGIPNIKTALIFISGVIIMRAAGCVINDYADKDFDRYVARTKSRPLASNKISSKNALLMFFVLISLALLLVIQLHPRTIILSFIALGLAIIYPFSKRFTNYPQVILGCAFAFGITMAYMEMRNILSLEAIILYISSVCWIVAFDTQYALADRQDDLKIGVKSTAITFGKYNEVLICILQLITILGYIIIGILRNLHLWFYLGLIPLCFLIIYQQYLLQGKTAEHYIRAFLNNNYFGAIVFVNFMLGLYF